MTDRPVLDSVCYLSGLEDRVNQKDTQMVPVTRVQNANTNFCKRVARRSTLLVEANALRREERRN